MDPLGNDKERPIPWKIYFAHTLSTWGDNMWWFAGGLYMMQLAPGSLRLTALYGLIIAASVICFGASVGNWIDKTKRIYAARTFLAIQNLCVSICALGISWFLWMYGSKQGLIQSNADIKPAILNKTYKEESELLDNYNTTSNYPGSTHLNLPSFETAKLITIIGVIMFSSIARLASSGTVIILQKDWIVVIADNDTDYLARINSILRTIELTTYMLAPIIAGQLFYFIGYIWTGVFIAIWNIVSVVGEYALLQGIYNQYPRLAHKITSSHNKHNIEEQNVREEACQLTNENNRQHQNGRHNAEEKSSSRLCGSVILDTFQESYQGWRTYFGHPVRNAGLGLALLYMTVLGFDNITYGYAIIQNVPESILGILVAISAVVGVLGSIAYPIIKRRLGLERTGLLGMFLLISTSMLSVASIFIPGSPFINGIITAEKQGAQFSIRSELFQKEKMDENRSFIDANIEPDQPSNVAHITILMTGIILARFGLWIVDLTITQILQERVEEERRGIINGVQDSLNNSMDLMKCILVILLPGANDFGYLIILSYISISSGWLLYAAFSRQQRGHLFHFSRLIPCNIQNELAPNPHWPFFPEPTNKTSKVHYDETETLRTSREFEPENGHQSIIKSNSAKTQQEMQSDRLEEIIDCNI